MDLRVAIPAIVSLIICLGTALGFLLWALQEADLPPDPADPQTTLPAAEPPVDEED
jgi:hypothetical protein